MRLHEETGLILESEREAVITEALAIRYVIVKEGGMANKSAVEDVLMLRHPGLTRYAAHDLMNEIEYRMLNPLRAGFYAAGAEPKIWDYPEIGHVTSIRYYKNAKRG